MKRMKRWIALVLALVWALALAACGGPTAQTPPSAPPQASKALESTPAETPPEASNPAETAPEGEKEESQPPAPASAGAQTSDPESPESSISAVTEDGRYNSKEEVALYIHLYGHLPDNYVTKREAEALGWSGGSVERYAGAGAAIGGSRFGNYEGLLPEARGRTYTECDIDTVGTSSRGPKRVVFSNDGLIYYTGDHYGSFELLYGEP